jgi:hypothetical protein
LAIRILDEKTWIGGDDQKDHLRSSGLDANAKSQLEEKTS